MARNIRGIESHQEINASKQWRDLRTPAQRFRSWMSDGDGMFAMGLGVFAAMWALPVFLEPLFLVGMLLFWWASRLQITLPFRLPATVTILDPNNPQSGKTEPGKAEGIAFLGNEMQTQRELWFTNSDMRTHVLVFGSTGAGKALPDDAAVHTPHGWARMDALQVGDAVTTADGRTAPVVGVFPQGELALYSLVLEDGRRVTASGDHLWAVLPYRPTGPLQMRRDGQGAEEVIDTLELQRRLDLGHWPTGTRGWALPLPQPPDSVPHPDAEDRNALVGAALIALAGQGPFPAPLVRGSRAQREAFWPAFWKAAGECGLTEHVGRSSLVTARQRDPLEALADAGRSMGWWAAVSEHDAGFQLELRREEAGVRVVRVESLQKTAPCRCIKIDDPTGLFLTNGWTVTHNTEALISMAYNSLVQGSGFIYIDGKGDNSLWAKIFSICRSLGREDDLLVINYMTGGRDVFGPQSTKLSNTLNPFINGSSGGLTELMVSLMSESSGGDDMWKGRAISLISAVMTALVYRRDYQGLLLDVDVIREHLVLEKIQDLTTNTKHRDLPVNIITPLRAYLRSLPGYVETLPAAKQNETALEQHGYLQMQFTKILGSLSDTYGYIFRTNLGEVDFFDVVVNRRILVVLLPAMEKSPDELGNLGKIIVACIKQMMATGLGDILEGDHKLVIETKPTESPAPYTCILDEYGYYVVKGAAVMPAQARSLGFCMVFAGQDFPSFKKNNNAEEAAATIGNCNIKIFMKVEDPTDTFDLFEKSVGEALASKTSGYDRETGAMGSRYIDGKNVNIERRKRGDLLDLKDQREGEAHILFKSTLVRATMFYANPAKVPKLQMNYFLRVKPPEKDHMIEFSQKVEDLKHRLGTPYYIDEQVLPGMPQVRVKRLETAQAVLAHFLQKNASARDAALCAVVAAFYKQSYAQLDALGPASQNLIHNLQDEPVHRDYLDAFGGTLDEEDMADFGDHNIEDEDAERAFLQEENFRKNYGALERASGVDEHTAFARAHATSEEMRHVSDYPPPNTCPEQIEPDDLINIIGNLSKDIEEGR